MKYETPECPYCHALTRRKFETGRNATRGSRLQHPRARVCQKGHKLLFKRDQKGG